MFGSYRRGVEDAIAVMIERGRAVGGHVDPHNAAAEIRERLLIFTPVPRHDPARAR